MGIPLHSIVLSNAWYVLTATISAGWIFHLHYPIIDIIADSFTDSWLSTQVYQFPTPTTNAASVGLKVSEASCWKLPGAPGAYLCWFISRWTVGLMVEICGIYSTLGLKTSKHNWGTTSYEGLGGDQNHGMRPWGFVFQKLSYSLMGTTWNNRGVLFPVDFPLDEFKELQLRIPCEHEHIIAL